MVLQEEREREREREREKLEKAASWRPEESITKQKPTHALKVWELNRITA